MELLLSISGSRNRQAGDALDKFSQHPRCHCLSCTKDSAVAVSLFFRAIFLRSSIFSEAEEDFGLPWDIWCQVPGAFSFSHIIRKILAISLKCLLMCGYSCFSI